MISQRTYKKDPRTWTTVWGLTMEVESGLGVQSRENWDKCNSIHNKKKIWVCINVNVTHVQRLSFSLVFLWGKALTQDTFSLKILKCKIVSLVGTISDYHH